MLRFHPLPLLAFPALVGLLVTTAVREPEDHSPSAAPIDVEAVFDEMRRFLEGEWAGRMVEIDAPVEATYYLAGNESALVEDMRRLDKPASRMHSVYHLADDRLQVTHYCSFRNQPRLLASSRECGERCVDFELLDVTNLSRSGDRYTHRIRVRMLDEDQAAISFFGTEEGREGVLTAQLTRIQDTERRQR